MNDQQEATVISSCKTEGYNHKRGLSPLQKRIIVYARKAMIAKKQTIDNSDIVFEIPAPKWLSDALVKALNGVFHGRKWGWREQGNPDTQTYHLDRFINFFDEVAYVERIIRNAAKEAGNNSPAPSLTQLYEWNEPFALSFLPISSGGKLVYHPWPYCDNRGWYFVLELQGGKFAKADIPDELKSLGGDAWEDTIRLAPDSYPINCTIPEILRDLYEFPVQGHIDAVAFDPEVIGPDRYNVAQASLRRACSRLQDRELIVIRGGQFSSVYVRSGVGLTPSGVALADGLIAQQLTHDG